MRPKEPEDLYSDPPFTTKFSEKGWDFQWADGSPVKATPEQSKVRLASCRVAPHCGSYYHLAILGVRWVGQCELSAPTLCKTSAKWVVSLQASKSHLELTTSTSHLLFLSSPPSEMWDPFLLPSLCPLWGDCESINTSQSNLVHKGLVSIILAKNHVHHAEILGEKAR